MDNNVQFIMSDPMKGARRPKTTGVRVDSNGVPLDIIAKQKENQKTAPDDITNDPAFMEMFGHAGQEQKDPWKQGGNEDNWYSGSPKPKTNTQTKTQATKTETKTQNPPENKNEGVYDDGHGCTGNGLL